MERRLQPIHVELATLSENLPAGVVGPTIMSMIATREAEREALLSRIEAMATPKSAAVPPHPALLRRFEDKIGRLRDALDEEQVRGEAAATIRGLIESITIICDPLD